MGTGAPKLKPADPKMEAFGSDISQGPSLPGTKLALLRGHSYEWNSSQASKSQEGKGGGDVHVGFHQFHTPRREELSIGGE